MALQRVGLAEVRRQVFGTSRERTLVLLRAAWPGVVGQELARRTEVVSLEGTTLRVRVPDAGWQKVLHRMRGDILSRLFAVAGELAPRRLGFVEPPRGRPTVEAAKGSDPAAPAPEAPSPALARPDLAPPSVVAAAAVIADEDLRRRFLTTAARYLSSRKS
jgi:hypothetical protein